MEAIFTEIYQKNAWGSPESRSGNGSALFRTESLRMALPVLLKGLDVKIMVDAPCGDLNWMRMAKLPIQKYIGCDIVSDLIIENQAKYANDTCQFHVVNIAKDILPYGDLIFSRDCLQHLDFASCLKALENFKLSGAKYLLTSSHTINTNQEINQIGGYRPLNLEKAPFNFPRPLFMIPDYDDYPKHLCLWSLESL